MCIRDRQYTVYHAWSGILTIVATLNLSSGVLNNLLVRGEYKRDTIVSALQGLSSVWAIGCVLIFLALCFFGVQIPSFSVYLWLIMLLSFVVTQAYDDWMVARRFTYDYKIPCLIMVIIAVMKMCIRDRYYSICDSAVDSLAIYANHRSDHLD